VEPWQTVTSALFAFRHILRKSDVNFFQSLSRVLYFWSNCHDLAKKWRCVFAVQQQNELTRLELLMKWIVCQWHRKLQLFRGC